jgi:hypothetical protein
MLVIDKEADTHGRHLTVRRGRGSEDPHDG